MTMLSRLPLAILMLALCGSAALAQAPGPQTKRLAVGTTGIMCVQLPCPWRGITDISDNRALMWSGEAMPPLATTPQDAARLQAAWEAMQCLEIEGAYDGGTLHVERVVGPCP